MVKLTKRKGFNFFRSYYDVYNELESAEDKVAFIDALLDRQFLGVKPEDLKGLAKFAYISQTNSIDSQVKGYEDKTGTKLCTPTVGGCQGVNKKDLTPTLQVQEKGEVQVQVQEEDKQTRFSFRKSLCDLGLNKNLVDDFLKNRKTKRLTNTETAFNGLIKEFGKNEKPLNELFEKIVENGWGSFKNSWSVEEKSSEKKKKKTAAEAIRAKYGITSNQQ